MSRCLLSGDVWGGTRYIGNREAAGETGPCMRGLASSTSPLSPGSKRPRVTFPILLGQAALAQLVERLTRNEKVESSILSGGSRNPDGCVPPRHQRFVG